MIVIKNRRYTRKQVIGGSGLFDAIGNIIKKLTGMAAKQVASKLLVSAGKSAASEAARRLVSSVMNTPATAPTAASEPVMKDSESSTVEQKAQDIISKYTNDKSININKLINGSAIAEPTRAVAIQDLIRKLSRGSGLKIA